MSRTENDPDSCTNRSDVVPYIAPSEQPDNGDDLTRSSSLTSDSRKSLVFSSSDNRQNNENKLGDLSQHESGSQERKWLSEADSSLQGSPSSSLEDERFERSTEGAAGSGSSQSKDSPVMMFGMLVVIGAIATNVFGFRHSRWAVGKDVHRAWQNYERTAMDKQAASSRRTEQQRWQQQQQYQTQQEQGARQREHADARDRFRRARAGEEARTRADREAQARADRNARSTAREQYQRWERKFRGPDGTYHETSYRVDFDPRILENLFGSRRDARSSSNSRNPFGMPEQVLEELLRAAQQQAEEVRRPGRSDNDSRKSFNDFDAFRFWERMNNAGGFDSNFGADMGSRGGTGSFGRMGLARYYSTLGLKQGASDAEIKAAYRKEAMKWHPDRYRGQNKEEAERKFREVTEAYNALTGK